MGGFVCSIYGALGRTINRIVLSQLAHAARDRGRDGGRLEFYPLRSDLEAALGNWRACPTPETEVGALQPYDRLVHNGTIANDVALGALPGEIDSQCLPRFLDRGSLQTLVNSLQQVRGSYALALVGNSTVYAATNYKPLHYASIEGTIYFSSMARHFEGLLPFGQAPVALAPYTAIDFTTQQILDIPRLDTKRAVVIASAGLDSTVAATKLVREGWDVCLLHFTYGCLAGTKEHEAIPKIADALNCKYQYLSIDLAAMLGLRSSTLFGSEKDIVGAIAGAEYAHEWVPGRNLVFVALAVAWAEAHGYHAVALGNNLEEGGGYPDNTEMFTDHLNRASELSVQAHYAMRVLAPVGNLMKKEVVALGLQLNAPLALCWSCYRGGERPCGHCGPCAMRRWAFIRNGMIDPLSYEMGIDGR